MMWRKLLARQHVSIIGYFTVLMVPVGRRYAPFVEPRGEHGMGNRLHNIEFKTAVW
jgi:hypothetical protein